jgi:hypothetical protein
VNDQGPLVAVGSSLFFGDTSNGFIHRADVSGSGLDVASLVDAVSFADVSLGDSRSRFAFLPADGAGGPRLVEATTYNVISYELSDDLGAVTATLPSQSSYPFSSVTALEILEDGTKIGYAAFSELFVCAVDLPRGSSPVPTCDSGRSVGISSPGAITVIDPSAGVDDETWILSGFGVVSIVNPGNSGTAFGVDAANVRPLLVNDCLLAFSSSSLNALDQAHPAAPAGRRSFPVGDVAQIGDRILVVGGGGEAGQLLSIPAPATSACLDGQGEPVLDGAAMLNGALRSQTELDAAAFLGGELYVLDADGVVWHVPTP